jgi:4-amino-4-deoxy-L-arabinose transferase-like glycosyltransferase
VKHDPALPGAAAQPRCLGQRHRLAVATVVAAAFVIRLLSAIALHVDMRNHFLFDTSVYDFLARGLADGRGYTGYLGQPMAFFPPGYPAILGTAYFLFGNDLAVAWTLNAMFGAITCLFTYATAARLFSRTVGLVAAAILAFFPGDIFCATVTASEATFACFFAGAIYAFVCWNQPTTQTSRWLVFGLVLGAATLVRGVALPFLAVPFVIWAVSRGLRGALAKTGLAAAMLLLVILPWTARNYFVLGYPILLGTDASFALLNAHNPLAFGSQSVEMNAWLRPKWSWLEALPLAQREGARSRAETRYALRYMLTHPGHELRLIPRRLYYLFENDHYHLATVPASRLPLRLYTVLSSVADAYFFAVLAFAIAGLATLRSLRDPSALVLPLTVVYILVMHGVLFFGDPRYHAPLVPVFSILAAAGLERVVSRVQHRSIRFR